MQKNPPPQAENLKGGFRAAILFTFILLIALYIIDRFVYTATKILPDDFVLGIVVLQLFLFWLDEAREKHRIIWVQEQREKLNEAKLKFSILTSHELMTPVAVIMGYVQLLKSRGLGDISEKQIKALDVMDKYIKRLARIRNDLEKLHTQAVLAQEDRYSPASLEELIKNSVQDVFPFIEKRKQHLILEIEEGIPEVTMYGSGIKQVIINLLLNAIRFTPDEGKIIIQAKSLDDYVQVQVEDNGIGIPKNKINHIFDSFYEAQDTFSHASGEVEFKSGGMGVGLSIAKNIIDNHNGIIRVESEEGSFSRFTFRIPLNRRDSLKKV